MFGIKSPREFFFIKASTALAKISPKLMKDGPLFALYLFHLGGFFFPAYTQEKENRKLLKSNKVLLIFTETHDLLSSN